MSKSTRRTKLSKDGKEDREYAAMNFVPWDYSPTPGPSQDQWMKWNTVHGAALRMSCFLMMQTKEQLAEFVLAFEEGECRFDDVVKMLDESVNFFSETAKIIQGAQCRLMVGASVVSVRIQNGEIPEPQQRAKPRLRLVKSLDDLRAGLPAPIAQGEEA
jgi:hypothetical protein